ncbi:LOW QUALITY PROTEIN: EF-hand domain-containing family member B [Ara ararauna]
MASCCHGGAASVRLRGEVHRLISRAVGRECLLRTGPAVAAEPSACSVRISGAGSRRGLREEAGGCGARKLLFNGNTAAGCLTEILPRPTPPTVRKFRNTTNPAPGVERIFYGRADDPDIASHLKHGIESPPSHSAASLINPLPKTSFQHKIQDKLEAIYLRNRRAPLSKSHDMLPKDLDILSTTFGTNTIQGVSGGELINPPKTFEEVDKEAREGHDLYIVSHNDYVMKRLSTFFFPEIQVEMLSFSTGKAINRKYDSPNFSKSLVYGIKPPHFEDGRYVSKSLNWHSAPEKRAEKIIPKQSHDFKKKFQPQLEKVHKVAETVPPDRTFGMSLCPYKYGVAELFHHGVPCEILHGKDRGRSLLTKVRQSLKKANYENFDMLPGAFRHYNKNGDGMIDKDSLRKSCFQLNLNLDDELLDSLFECCDLDKDGLINYLEFTNFLNWKNKTAVKEFEEKIITKAEKMDALFLPEDTKGLKQEDLVLKKLESSEKTPEMLTGPADHVFANYQTTSSQYSAVVGGLPTTCCPGCGVPSIRSDLPAPRIRRLSDRTNYGDDTSAYALLFPSVFSQKGVYEKDFFKTRPKAEIAGILCNIGMKISDERFQEIWKQASMKHQKEEICVESIKNILEKIHASHTETSC